MLGAHKVETNMQVQTNRSNLAPVTREATSFHALILLGTVICSTLAPMIVGPVLPAMQEHFSEIPGIQTLVPLVVTAPMLVLGALAMIMGAISDRLGRKRVLVYSLILYAVAGTAPLYLKSIYTIIASRALVGVAEAAAMTVGTSLIGDYFTGARRDRYASLQITVASTSAFIFNLVGGVLGSYGWRIPFIAYALPLLLAPLVQVYLWDPVRASNAAIEEHTVGDAEPEFKPRLLTLICLVGFAVGLVFMIVPVHLSYMMVQVGVNSTSAIGVAYALNSIGVIIGTLMFGWLFAARLSVSRQFAVGMLICAAGFACMGTADSFVLLTLGGVINGVGSGVILPALVSWGLRSLPFSRRGFGTGAFTATQFIGYFCSPLIVMPMVVHWGSRFVVLQGWGVALAVLSAITFAGIPARRTLKVG
jgi:MFS family permease